MVNNPVLDKYRYYSVYINLLNPKYDSEIILCLVKEELLKRVLLPREQGVTILVNGKTIPWSNVDYIRIAGTNDSKDSLLARARHEEANSRVIVGGLTEYKAWSYGEDLTNELITAPVGAQERDERSEKSGAVQRLEQLLDRFHAASLKLRVRHDSRSGIEIQDEYDVQDVLHALLKTLYTDVRPEEYTPSYAGRNSRVDFLCKEASVAIEVKMTRAGLKDKEVGDQLIIDISRYRGHPSVKCLVCFVYDPSHYLINPTGIETDLTRVVDGLDVRVLVRPMQ